MNEPLSRREFLRGATGAIAGASIARLSEASGAASTGAAQSRPAAAVSATSAPAKSDVVHVRSDSVLIQTLVRPDILDEMLSRSLEALTGAANAAEAWHALLRQEDVIGIKFNRTASRELGTTPVMARVLVRSLQRAGFPPDRVVLIEAPDSVVEQLGTRPAPTGWSTREVDFGSGRDRFAEALDQITALINVPFLKTHNIAGMTACLKNLSHGLVRRPALYHGNHCSPFIADIVAAEPIRSRMRLHIINALRSVVDGGPEARTDAIWACSSLIMSLDPVAADTVGLELLNQGRKSRGLKALDDDGHPILYLSDAARRGLGQTSWDWIRQISVSV